jgi:hypothetical protein
MIGNGGRRQGTEEYLCPCFRSKLEVTGGKNAIIPSAVAQRAAFSTGKTCRKGAEQERGCEPERQLGSGPPRLHHVKAKQRNSIAWDGVADATAPRQWGYRLQLSPSEHRVFTKTLNRCLERAILASSRVAIRQREKDCV